MIVGGVYEAEWLDSMVLDHGEWLDLEDADDAMSVEGMTHTTVGYLMKETDHSILLVSSRGQNDRIQGAIVIPKSALSSLTAYPKEEK